MHCVCVVFLTVNLYSGFIYNPSVHDCVWTGVSVYLCVRECVCVLAFIGACVCGDVLLEL